MSESLAGLGVTVDKSQRLGPGGEALPADYAPLGSRQTLYAGDATQGNDATDQAAPKGVSELLMVGVQRPSRDGAMAWLELDPSAVTNTRFTTDILFSESLTDAPWAASVGDDPPNRRALVAGDYDGDGRDEIAAVYQAGAASDITLQLYDDKQMSFARGQSLTVAGAGVETFEAVACDVDGDGRQELALARATADSASIWYFRNVEGTLVAPGAAAASFIQASPGSTLQLSLACGNLDFDAGEETVLVVNEFAEGGGGALTRHYVLDDANESFASRGSGMVQGAADGVLSVARVADVALGDIDRDNVDEIVFAGLPELEPDVPCNYEYLLIALDDLASGQQEIASAKVPADIHEGRCATTPGVLGYVHVNTLDVDGDNVDEVQANQLVFDDFSPRETPPGWSLLHALDGSDLFLDDGGFGGRFDHRNTSIATADVTNDGREDVIAYAQDTETLSVWGISNAGDSAPFGAGWRRLHQVETAEVGDAGPIRPLILAANVDSEDSTVVKISAGSHRVVYTEPVIIAVLAAAPCYDNLGQNPFNCRTSYGSSESTSTRSEFATSVTAGVAVTASSGVNLGIAKFTAEITKSIQATLGFAWSTSYSITRSVTYTTAPIQDEVVFTTIPYDVYVYEVLSHPQAEIVGTELAISLPRDITIYKVALDHYQRNVVDGGPQIAGAVLTHTRGRPLTYPTAAQKDALVQAAESVTLNSFLDDIPLVDRAFLPQLFDVRLFGDIAGSLELGTAAVNPGEGAVTQTIAIAEDHGRSYSGRIEGSISLKPDVEVFGNGAEVKVTVGVGVGANFSVVHGSGTTYSGSVADIPEANFAGNGYSWGIFTYLHQDGDTEQQFDVVHYWVE